MSPHIVINRSLSVEFTHVDTIPYPSKKFNRWRKKIVSFLANTPTEAEIVHTPAKMTAAAAEIVPTREKIVYTAAKIIPTTAKMITTSAKIIPTSAEIIDTTAKIIHARAKIIPTSAEIVHTAAKMTATTAEIVPTTKKIIHTALETVRKSRGTVFRDVCIVPVVKVNISSAVWIIFDQLEVKNLRQIKIKILIGGFPMYLVMSTMSERLVSAKLSLTNALADDYILSQLSLLGLDETRLNEGMGLYQTAEQLYQKQKREYGEQYEATKAVEALWQEARKEVNMYVTVANLMLDDSPSLRNMLGLHESRKFSLPNWITWAKVFCINAMQSTEVMEKFAGFSVTMEKLQAALQKVEQLESANAKQEAEKGEAQQATRDRDAAFVELDKFMYMFNKIARAVLVDKPEYLEKLGILERSAPIPKAKAEEPITPQPVVSDNINTAADTNTNSNPGTGQ
ncbi:MAG: hypothetical protein GTO20_22170 [Candidatus Aminicenantes bacterium]|nr:hypothetical protein [Candidatus Aminicenantes bacterium]